MNLYAIFRRDGFDPNEIDADDQRSNAELERRADKVRKIRSYVLEEPGGRLGAICLYEATALTLSVSTPGPPDPATRWYR